jgi:hypothetical protein
LLWFKNTKEIARPSRRDVHIVEHSSDSSDDESSEVLTAEFIWPSKAKFLTCDAVKLTQTVSPGGQTTSFCSSTVRPSALVGPTAISYEIGTSSGIDGTSSPASMEEGTDDDLRDYEPSPAHDGMDVNVIY